MCARLVRSVSGFGRPHCQRAPQLYTIACSPTGQWRVFRGMALACPEMPMLATNKSRGHIEDSSLGYLEAVRLFPLLTAVFTDQTPIYD